MTSLRLPPLKRPPPQLMNQIPNTGSPGEQSIPNLSGSQGTSDLACKCLKSVTSSVTNRKPAGNGRSFRASNKPWRLSWGSMGKRSTFQSQHSVGTSLDASLNPHYSSFFRITLQALPSSRPPSSALDSTLHLSQDHC